MNDAPRHKRHGTLLRILSATIVIAVVTLAVMGGLELRKRRLDALGAQEPPRSQPWALIVAPVRRGPITREFPALATVETSAEIIVYGQIMGTILEMGPREGVEVKEGDLLARIDDRELTQEIKAKEARLGATAAKTANREVELEREKKLLASGGTSKSRVDALQTAVLESRDEEEALRREIAALEVRKSFSVVRSPADGIISARLAEPGALCSPSHPLYRLTDSHGSSVSVKLPQNVIEKVRLGGVLVLKHGLETRRLSIDRIHPTLDSLGLGTVESDLPDRPFGLVSGSRIDARIILDERTDALIVPIRAVLFGEGRKGLVFKVVGDDADARLRAVPVLADLISGREVAVLGDLEPGDRIAQGHRSTLQRLRDGDPVRGVVELAQ